MVITPIGAFMSHRDAGKPDLAVPVTIECALPGAFIQGEVTASPFPILALDATRHLTLEIRPPRPEDLAGILSVVRSCAPYLTPHIPYIYWMQIRQCREICGVAQMEGEIVGWCSAMRGPSRKYFLHQLGVAPKARCIGVARALLMHLVLRLEEQSAVFQLEFTIDRRNGAALALVKTVAGQAGMKLRKSGEPVRLPDEGCAEDLYALTGIPSGQSDFSDEVPNALWTTTERTVATPTSESNF
jgi:ribosomal protein S18 acetylase RimI-like enzyme